MPIHKQVKLMSQIKRDVYLWAFEETISLCGISAILPLTEYNGSDLLKSHFRKKM